MRFISFLLLATKVFLSSNATGSTDENLIKVKFQYTTEDGILISLNANVKKCGTKALPAGKAESASISILKLVTDSNEVECKLSIPIPISFLRQAKLVNDQCKKGNQVDFDILAERLGSLKMDGCINLADNVTGLMGWASPIVSSLPPTKTGDSSVGYNAVCPKPTKKKPTCPEHHLSDYQNGFWDVREKSYDSKHFGTYYVNSGNLYCHAPDNTKSVQGQAKKDNSGRLMVTYTPPQECAPNTTRCSGSRLIPETSTGLVDASTLLPNRFGTSVGRDFGTIPEKYGNERRKGRLWGETKVIDKRTATAFCYAAVSAAIVVYETLGISHKTGEHTRRVYLGDLDPKFVEGFLEGTLAAVSHTKKTSVGSKAVTTLEFRGPPTTIEPFRWLELPKTDPKLDPFVTTPARTETVFKPNSIVFIQYSKERICRMEIPMPSGYENKLSETMTTVDGTVGRSKKEYLRRLVFDEAEKFSACIDIDVAGTELVIAREGGIVEGSSEGYKAVAKSGESTVAPPKPLSPVKSPELVQKIVANPVKLNTGSRGGDPVVSVMLYSCHPMLDPKVEGDAKGRTTEDSKHRSLPLSAPSKAGSMTSSPVTSRGRSLSDGSSRGDSSKPMTWTEFVGEISDVDATAVHSNGKDNRIGRELGNIVMYKVGDFGYPQSEVYAWGSNRKKTCRVVVNRAMRVYDIVFDTKMVNDKDGPMEGGQIANVVKFLFRPGSFSNTSFSAEGMRIQRDSKSIIDDKERTIADLMKPLDYVAKENSIVFRSYGEKRKCRLEIAMPNGWKADFDEKKAQLEVLDISICPSVATRSSSKSGDMAVPEQLLVATPSGDTSSIAEISCIFKISESNKPTRISWIVQDASHYSAESACTHPQFSSDVVEVYRVVYGKSEINGLRDAFTKRPISWTRQTSGDIYETDGQDLKAIVFARPADIQVKDNSVVLRQSDERSGRKCRLEIAIPKGKSPTSADGKLKLAAQISWLEFNVCPPASAGTPVSPQSLHGKVEDKLTIVDSSLPASSIAVSSASRIVHELFCSGSSKALLSWIVVPTSSSDTPFGSDKPAYTSFCNNKELARAIVGIYNVLINGEPIGGMDDVLIKPSSWSMQTSLDDKDSFGSRLIGFKRPFTVPSLTPNPVAVQLKPNSIVFREYAMVGGKAKRCRLEIPMPNDFQAVEGLLHEGRLQVAKLRSLEALVANKLCSPKAPDVVEVGTGNLLEADLKGAADSLSVNGGASPPRAVISADELICKWKSTLEGGSGADEAVDSLNVASWMTSGIDNPFGDGDKPKKLCNGFVLETLKAVYKIVYGDAAVADVEDGVPKFLTSREHRFIPLELQTSAGVEVDGEDDGGSRAPTPPDDDKPLSTGSLTSSV
jgi:hypothetical protein